MILSLVSFVFDYIFIPMLIYVKWITLKNNFLVVSRKEHQQFFISHRMSLLDEPVCILWPGYFCFCEFLVGFDSDVAVSPPRLGPEQLILRGRTLWAYLKHTLDFPDHLMIVCLEIYFLCIDSFFWHYPTAALTNQHHMFSAAQYSTCSIYYPFQPRKWEVLSDLNICNVDK